MCFWIRNVTVSISVAESLVLLPLVTIVLLQYKSSIQQVCENEQSQCNNRVPALQCALIARSNIQTHLHSPNLIPSIHTYPFPTPSRPSSSTLTKLLQNVCGVTASPASSSTHINLQRLTHQTHSSPENTELSAALHPSKKLLKTSKLVL